MKEFNVIRFLDFVIYCASIVILLLLFNLLFDISGSMWGW